MTNHDITLHPDEALNGNLEDCARLLFPQKGESKPRLRFRGFEGEWSRKMIGTIGMTYSGLSGKGKNDFGHGDAKYITFLNVLNNVQIDCSRFEKVEIREGENQNKVHKGDLLFNTSSETPEEVAMCAVMGEEIDNLYLNSFCFGFRLVVPDVDPLFLAYQMRSPYGRSLMSFIAQGATRYNLPKKEFVKTEIIIPKDIEEQRQIASFLCHLDEQIAVKQRQLERLKQMKLACFGSLFPDNQSITPPLRFKGFSGGWKSVILMDIMDRYDNLRVPVKESQRVKGEYPYYGANGIQDYVDGYTHDGEFILIAEDGANNLIEYPVQYVNGKVWVNNHAHVLSAKKNVASNMFIKYAISHADVKSVLVGGTRAKLTSDALMKLSVSIPPTINEQCRIASFFSSLDEQIKIQMQQVEKLNQVKKACLNQFIA